MTVTTGTAASDYASVSSPNGEPIAVWERVSTDMTRQEIASQTRDLVKFLGAGSYRVERVFRIEASAYHGKHDPELREALADVRAGRYVKVVAAMSSRFERRGWKPLLAYMIELDEAGGRLVAVDNPVFGDMSNLVGGMTSMMNGDAAHDYSDQISKNVSRMFRLMDEAGAFRGIAPAGYAIAGAEHAKRLVPATERREVKRTRQDRASDDPKAKIEVTVTLPSAADIRQAFDDAPMVSTVKLAERLGMSPDGVNAMLRNKVYSTGSYPVRRKDGVTVIHRCEPLVTHAVQDRALQALERRRTGDNVSSRALAKDDFSGALWCDSCQLATMYRYYGGGRKRADGTPGPKVRRYVCGNCRKSVDAGHADAEVSALMSGRTEPWLKPEWVSSSDDYKGELESVLRELDELTRRGLDRRAEQAERERLWAEQDRLEPLAGASVAGHWEGKFTGKSEGQHWGEMESTAGRRAWLASGEFRIYVKAAPGRKGNVLAEFAYTDEAAA